MSWKPLTKQMVAPQPTAVLVPPRHQPKSQNHHLHTSISLKMIFFSDYEMYIATIAEVWKGVLNFFFFKMSPADFRACFVPNMVGTCSSLCY
jgi:hypothetical protein